MRTPAPGRLSMTALAACACALLASAAPAQDVRDVILNAAKPAHLLAGGFVEFALRGNSSYIEIDGTRFNLKNKDVVRLTVGADGNGRIYITGDRMTSFTFDDVTVEVNGQVIGIGSITAIYLTKDPYLTSTLALVTPPAMAWTQLRVDGTDVIYGDDSREILIENLQLNGGGVMNLNNEGGTVWYDGGATGYQIDPGETPTATPTSTPEPTATPTSTPEPTATPTSTPEPTATPTSTPEPTATPTSTLEPTATPTSTPEPTATPTSTPEPTATPTSTPEPTATATSTPEPTSTPTSTPEPTATATSTPEPTATATSTPEPTATPTSTPEPTATATSTPEPTATATSTPEPTATPTGTPLVGDTFVLPFQVSPVFSGGEDTCRFNNQYEDYSCIKFPETGPDVVYSFSLAAPGTIDVTLSGLSADLDLFLCDGPSADICAAESTNPGTQDERITYAAGTGTYYVVIDGYDGACSAFSIDIRGIVPGETFESPIEVPSNFSAGGTTCGFASDYEAYGCIKFPETGPDVVYSFSLAGPATVNISLTGLTADLDLFLFDAPDPESCVAFSANPGPGDEAIEHEAGAGTYYVVVDGFDGACGDYEIGISSTVPATPTPTATPTSTPEPTATHTPTPMATSTPSGPTPTPSPTPRLFAAKITFEPTDFQTPDGWMKDDGSVFGPKLNHHTYGWTDR
ncbi:MAG: pre-peptidase C-terminal domain-containing protein [bacterium]|nr:pre-peptidase C-terminal domain-containing protein [bacterium]